ncbi:hypothetical protein VN24_23015 [Paenibacillus beijingensis]|uniref:Cytochrome C biogenesis protein transmembrane domain-containing protein n=1 Tax=Paenibacillus beijingensis TaxID=1126833 RepID=A0A0D5NSR6_9BACL|nr:hypothetical protein VN24_23015 [Paenibacillus beijingensis]
MTWIAAFTAGLFSFLSPCVLPLVPAFLSHLTGSAVSGGKIGAGKAVLLLRSLCFITGFSIVFVTLGASTTLAGQWLGAHRIVVSQASGFIIVLFGLYMAGLLHLKLPGWSLTGGAVARLPKGMTASLLTGIAFAAGWTPCVGLPLASILLLAGAAETMRDGIGYLTVYSLGMGVPFLAAALVLSYSLAAVKSVNRYIPLFTRINGFVLIVAGAALVTGQWGLASAWLNRVL